MLSPALDERLQAVAALFIPSMLGADIGADHGHLSCALLQSGKCQRMIVSDISAASLEKAQKLFARHGLDRRADFRVADGFAALRPGEKAECAALCGVGGALMARILQRSDAESLPRALVLSANTDIPLVRTVLMGLGYRLTAERIVRAKRRFYIVMRAERGAAAYSERDLYLGPVLLQERPELLRDYLTWREGVVACEAGHEKQLQWIREELAYAAGNCTNGLSMD